MTRNLLPSMQARGISTAFPTDIGRELESTCRACPTPRCYGGFVEVEA